MFDLNLKDQHGQPTQVFRPNIENNISKAFDRLIGLCMGILADGELNRHEAIFFQEWVDQIAELEPIWPFPEISNELKRIYSTREIEAETTEQVKQLIQKILGSDHCNGEDIKDSYSSDLPLNSPPPSKIVFSGSQFVLTGRFEFGTRAKVVEKIKEHKGCVKDGFPNKETSYLVIGSHVSRDWYYTSYGRKIERAMELRDEGYAIAIISEAQWKENIDEN